MSLLRKNSSYGDAGCIGGNLKWHGKISQGTGNSGIMLHKSSVKTRQSKKSPEF
ncbi:hypothetical protein A2U01_0056751, partial [Trifolium medium]|nr:hypothetical protein [Trifolium medium]